MPSSGPGTKWSHADSHKHTRPHIHGRVFLHTHLHIHTEIRPPYSGRSLSHTCRDGSVSFIAEAQHLEQSAWQILGTALRGECVRGSIPPPNPDTGLHTHTHKPSHGHPQGHRHRPTCTTHAHTLTSTHAPYRGSPPGSLPRVQPWEIVFSHATLKAPWLVWSLAPATRGDSDSHSFLHGWCFVKV